MIDLLEVPEKVATAMRPVQNPDLTLLRGDQPEAFNRLKAFLEHDTKEVFVLSGPAGTGKTTLMSFFLEYVLFNKQKRIAVTAPVNKAVKVSKSKAQYSSSRLDYMTTHRLLGLREVIKPDGSRTFKPQFGVEAKVGEYDVIIVDECSMIGQDLETELFEQVYKKKLIFVGDHRQLPPIGEKISPVFDKYLTGKFDGFTLEKILRQAEGSPIIELSQEILRDHRVIDYGLDSKMINGIGYLMIEDNREYADLLLKHFLSDQFKKDSEYCKLITWTNDAASRVNHFVRKHRYAGQEIKQMMPGEHLITKSPIFDLGGEGNIIYHTNDDLEVIEVEPDTHRLGTTIVLDCFRVKVAEIDNLGQKYMPRYIKVIADSSKDKLNEVSQKIASMARKATHPGEKSNLWKEYYSLMQNFADVTYNSAITCHRAQGSTYTNSFVLYSDMSKNPKVYEKQAMYYTAVTRASNRLFLYC